MKTISANLRCQIARRIDPDAWADLDRERKNYPADPLERFFEHPKIETSLKKTDDIIAMLQAKE
jgi:hypothetical protein